MLGGKRSHVSATTPDSRLSTKTGPGSDQNYCKRFHICEHEVHHTGQITSLRKRLPVHAGLPVEANHALTESLATQAPILIIIITVRNSSKAARPSSISPNSHGRAAVIRLPGAADIGAFFFWPRTPSAAFPPRFPRPQRQLGLRSIAAFRAARAFFLPELLDNSNQARHGPPSVEHCTSIRNRDYSDPVPTLITRHVKRRERSGAGESASCQHTVRVLCPGSKPGLLQPDDR
jgi:hypothetical protein